MSLKEELLEIQGVGDATADKIIAVVKDHDTDTEAVEKAVYFLENKNTRAAKSVLESALDN